MNFNANANFSIPNKPSYCDKIKRQSIYFSETISLVKHCDNISSKAIIQIEGLREILSQRVARDPVVRQVRIIPKEKSYNYKASLLR